MEEREPRVEIKEGESAAITCKAKGKPPPTYTWIKASTREVNKPICNTLLNWTISISLRAFRV